MTLCPRDGEVLARNDAAGFRYLSCEHCGGHWIPGAALHQAMVRHDLATFPPLPETASALACLGCRRPLRLVRVEDCAVDVCPHCHGVWLDGGEILKLAAWFPESSQILSSARDRLDFERHGSACLGVELGATGLLALLHLVFKLIK